MSIKETKRGRPHKFDSPEQMQGLIDDYFEKTPDKEITITGLAIHLDTTREGLCNYEGYSEDFYDTIKKAKNRIANEYERDLRKQGRSGDIFALKNFGWKDKQEVEHSGEVGVNLADLAKQRKTDREG